MQRSPSLHEQTYRTLRAAILTGELVGGDRLVETQLAEKLKVSRTPVREAIRQLQRDNLITPNDQGGLQVAILSVTDAANLYDCRLALEHLSITGACHHATLDQLSQLEQIVTKAEQSTHQGLTNSQLLQNDFQFHHLLAESSGNKWLVSLLTRVFDQMALLRMRTMEHNPGVLEIKTEHRYICQAVCERNSALAIEAIQSHLVASKHRVIAEIKKIEQIAQIEKR
jgi:DNA-binding GntR family transcriptional regulator